MSVIEFVSHLHSLGVKFSVKSGKLNCVADKGVITPIIFEQIKNCKDEILNLILEIDNEINVVQPIQSISRKTKLPLSYSQERFWFLDQLASGSSHYNLSVSTKIVGELDTPSFCLAYQYLIERHEILRSYFPQNGTEPILQIGEGLDCELSVIDLSDLIDEIKKREIQNLIVKNASINFNLQSGPLYNASLLKVSENCHVFLFTLHHIIVDGWSFDILRSELASLYYSLSVNKPISLLPLTIQYADFAYWQRKESNKHLFDKQLDYWHKKLEDSPALLNFPLDFRRPRLQTFDGVDVPVSISKSLTEGLKELSFSNNATLFMTLLAAFKILLFCFSRQKDICIGTIVSGRTSKNLESMVGLFVNALPLRSNLSRDYSFVEFLAQLRSTTLDAFDNQEIPFQLLVEKIIPQRSLSYSPFYQVQFVLQNTPNTKLRVSKIELQQMGHDDNAARHDLTLNLKEGPDGINGGLEYNIDLFEEESIKRLVDLYVKLLDSILVNSNQTIDEYMLQISHCSNNYVDKSNFPIHKEIPGKCIHHIFEEFAKLQGDAVALLINDKTITYSELNERANRLAHSLLELGVTSESVIGLCMERSIELVVGLIGILKSGAAYLPIDPTIPDARINYMISDSNSELVICDVLTQAKFHKLKINVLDIQAGLQNNEKEDPNVIIFPENLAYVIYTSGSTGNPKGVLCQHLNITRLFQVTDKWFDFTEKDVWTLFHNIAFDFSVWELWGALSHGGSLVIIPNTVARDPSAFCQLLNRFRITILNLTPTAFGQILDTLTSGNQSVGLELRHVIFGGEALDAQVFARWYELYKSEYIQLTNMYGITEITVHGTNYEITPDTVFTNCPGSIIGEPLADIRAYILDEYQNVCPINAYGELHLSGKGLARGYLNRPSLTAERFIPNPFDKANGDRLYKTGDYVRFRNNGDLEYLNRIDNQVKIRGYRIELGEIKSCLIETSLVKDAVVLVQSVNEEERICAYIIADGNFQYGADKSNELNATLNQWQEIFDQTYIDKTVTKESFFNISGWNSSYSGKPMPESQMKQWVDSTVESLIDLKPKRILELGCGTGLLLGRIAPYCESYTGTDLSVEAISQIKEQLPSLGKHADKVKVYHGSADDLKEFSAGEFDTIIINSVIQCFPSVDYLMTVLQNSIELLTPNGKLYIGDVRHFGLMDLFHRSVCLYQSKNDETIEDFNKNVTKRIANDKDLLIEPQLFLRFAEICPQIKYVQIIPKNLSYVNELSKYRYDVVFHLTITSDKLELEWKDWDQHFSSIENLGRYLESKQPETLAIKSIPNARLFTDIYTRQLSNEIKDSDQTIGFIKKRLKTIVPLKTEPNLFREFGIKQNYNVDINWSNSGNCGDFDVVFSSSKPIFYYPSEHLNLSKFDLHWQNYANRPGGFQKNQTLPLVLREKLKDRLPDYMVPNVMMVVDEFPLTPNGKLDRNALPSPEPGVLTDAYVAPRTDIELTLSQIWSELLGVDRVGIHDNFFELGGHSLLATRVISALRQHFEIELPLRSLFESPTVSGLAVHVVDEQAQARWLLAPPLSPVSREQALPLSYAQQRLWFLDQLEPDSAFYNIPVSVELLGRLDLKALRQTFCALVERHESLRTVFTIDAGEAVQQICNDVTIRLPLIDLSGLASSDRLLQSRLLAQSESVKPFNLSTGPLLRVQVLKLEDERHHLLLSLHHIVSDGWSMGVLLREVASLYASYCMDESPQLMPLPVQYADYAVWQREWLQGEVLSSQLGYWREQLSDCPSLLELPTDRVRPAVQSYSGSTHGFEHDAGLTAQLNGLSQAHGVTLFMTLLSGFSVLLSRYSHQEDVCIGSPIANRTRSELEGLIGFFVNTLVLRADLSGDPSFEVLLDRVKSMTLAAYEHQDVPFEHLVDALSVERDMSRSPLFQVMFALQNAPMGSIASSDIEMRGLPVEGVISKFDLSLELTEIEDGIIGKFEYNTDLFDGLTIERLSVHFEQLLRGLVADPSSRISEVEMLTQAERDQQLVEWNDTAVAYPRDKCVHELFEEQASICPDAVALVYAGSVLTYGELNARSNQLAHYLLGRGVVADGLVGICMDRSLEMVIGILGVLKSGSGYVPIDPGYPSSRIGYMLSDSGVGLVLTSRQVSALDDSFAGETISIDSDWDAISSQPITKLGSTDCCASNLMYVIYTSGSTGAPKGVGVCHRSVLNCLSSLGQTLSLDKEARVLSLTTLSFDISVLELFLPLVTGAKLLVVGRSLAMDGKLLSGEIERSCVTHVQATPVTWGELADAGGVGLARLKGVLCGGEALSQSLAEKLLRHTDAVLNLYGPTETTIWSAYSRVTAEQDRVSIGRGLNNTQCYILNSAMDVVPQGVLGELYIGGDGLARGYLNRGGLTAEKFIPNPFGGEGDRLYRTGDIVRYLADGNIEYIGRVDHQVKVRGFRIELGEIESSLLSHECVKESVVLARTESGDTRLVGYVVLSSELDTSELRDYLKDRLPDYMVPGVLMVVDEFPLTPNGKLDRNALPSPEPGSLTDAYVAPRTDIELTLSQIWSEVLGVDRVGIHDNFFELGGHSLLATRVISALRQHFEIELPLRSLFESPTVAGLAEHVIDEQAQSRWLLAPPLSPVSREQALPLSYAQQRLWFLDQLEPGSAFYNMPVSVELLGRLDLSALRQTFNALVERHESLRTVFTMDAGEAVQQIRNITDVPLPLVDLSGLAAPERLLQSQLLAQSESVKSFNLSTGPLLRVQVLKLEDERHHLLLSLHHIVSDAWSMGVLLREVAHLYEAYRLGKLSALLPLPVQYADYAVWQRDWLQGEVLEAQLGYWREQLSDCPSLLELPTDRVRPAVQSYSGSTHGFELDAGLTAQLNGLSQAQGVTLFMTLIEWIQCVVIEVQSSGGCMYRQSDCESHAQ